MSVNNSNQSFILLFVFPNYNSFFFLIIILVTELVSWIFQNCHKGPTKTELFYDKNVLQPKLDRGNFFSCLGQLFYSIRDILVYSVFFFVFNFVYSYKTPNKFLLFLIIFLFEHYAEINKIILFQG